MNNNIKEPKIENQEYVVVRLYSSYTAKNTLLKVGSRYFKSLFDANNWAEWMNTSDPHENKWIVIAVETGTRF